MDEIVSLKDVGAAGRQRTMRKIDAWLAE